VDHEVADIHLTESDQVDHEGQNHIPVYFDASGNKIKTLFKVLAS